MTMLRHHREELETTRVVEHRVNTALLSIEGFTKAATACSLASFAFFLFAVIAGAASYQLTGAAGRDASIVSMLLMCFSGAFGSACYMLISSSTHAWKMVEKSMRESRIRSPLARRSSQGSTPAN